MSIKNRRAPDSNHRKTAETGRIKPLLFPSKHAQSKLTAKRYALNETLNFHFRKKERPLEEDP